MTHLASLLAASTVKGPSIGFSLTVLLVAYVIGAFGVYGFFKKAGQPGWAAFVPIYNLYIVIKIIGRPDWWLALLIAAGLLYFFLPFVGWIAVLVVGWFIASDLARSFGKSTAFAIGLLFLSVIFTYILSYGSAQYLGPAAGVTRGTFGGGPQQSGGYGQMPGGYQQGGYPPGGYGPPPQGGYGTPPGGYGAPPQGGYGTPPGGYGPPAGGYGAPQGGYAPPPAPGYGPPQGGHAPPPSYPPPGGGYPAPSGGYPPPQGGYAPAPGDSSEQGGYTPPQQAEYTEQYGYGSPAAEPSVPPTEESGGDEEESEGEPT